MQSGGPGWAVLLCSFGLACGCGSSSRGEPDATPSAAGSAVGGGEQSAAGSTATGDAVGGGTAGSGGGSSRNVGRGGNGAAGAPPAGRCRTSADCPIDANPTASATQCLFPGQPTPPSPCGAPGWCGECNCPPQPAAPNGSGMNCTTSNDCPAPSGGTGAASICVQGVCVQCDSDADCPAAMPVCASVGSATFTLFRMCSACRVDQSCSGATPRCVATAGVGRCVACASDQDCADGVCRDGSCVPQCDGTRACHNGFDDCTASHRCEARYCSTGADCATPNTACNGGRCIRRPCDEDGDCDETGSCVNGACYDMLGSCYTQYRVP